MSFNFLTYNMGVTSISRVTAGIRVNSGKMLTTGLAHHNIGYLLSGGYMHSSCLTPIIKSVTQIRKLRKSEYK